MRKFWNFLIRPTTLKVQFFNKQLKQRLWYTRKLTKKPVWVLNVLLGVLLTVLLWVTLDYIRTFTQVRGYPFLERLANIHSLPITKQKRASQAKKEEPSAVDPLEKEKVLLDVEKAWLESQNSAYAFIAQTVTGIFLLGGLIVSYRNLLNSEKNTRETLKLSLDSQVSQRFIKATEMLNSDNQYECLGGIYSLEQLGKTSKEYYWQTIEVLAAYARLKAPAELELVGSSLLERRKPIEPFQELPPETPIDIQGALNIIFFLSSFRNSMPVGGKYSSFRGFIDLSMTTLRDIGIRNADLSGAWMRGSNLSHSVIYRTNLRNAYLDFCRLSDVTFEEVSLFEANLQNSYLGSTIFKKVSLRGTKLKNAILYASDLRGSTELEQWQIDEAFGDESTKLPDGLKRPLHWKRSYKGTLPTPFVPKLKSQGLEVKELYGNIWED